LQSKPSYVRLPQGKAELYDEYPDLSIEEWHKKHGSFVE